MAADQDECFSREPYDKARLYDGQADDEVVADGLAIVQQGFGQRHGQRRAQVASAEAGGRLRVGIVEAIGVRPAKIGFALWRGRKPGTRWRDRSAPSAALRAVAADGAGARLPRSRRYSSA